MSFLRGLSDDALKRLDEILADTTRRGPKWEGIHVPTGWTGGGAMRKCPHEDSWLRPRPERPSSWYCILCKRERARKYLRMRETA